MSVKMDRLNKQFAREITSILHDVVNDKRVKLVTVNEVRITADLSYAKVYYTSFDNEKVDSLIALNKISGFIRSELCKKINIRKMPEIQFIYDNSIEYGDKIDKIIGVINNDK